MNMNSRKFQSIQKWISFFESENQCFQCLIQRKFKPFWRTFIKNLCGNLFCNHVLYFKIETKVKQYILNLSESQLFSYAINQLFHAVLFNEYIIQDAPSKGSLKDQQTTNLRMCFQSILIIFEKYNCIRL
jgi:hypothetical protein